MKTKRKLITISASAILFCITSLIFTNCKKDEPIIKKDIAIIWANPADITVGTSLSAAQLNATADVPGTFVYTPASGTLLSVGADQVLKVDFTPADAVNYNTATKSVKINITKKIPILTWANPADITVGTLLDAVQLNAIADVPGTFVYTPASGTSLSIGANQDLKVDFTPTDAVNYNIATKTVKINVNEKSTFSGKIYNSSDGNCNTTGESKEFYANDVLVATLAAGTSMSLDLPKGIYNWRVISLTSGAVSTATQNITFDGWWFWAGCADGTHPTEKSSNQNSNFKENCGSN